MSQATSELSLVAIGSSTSPRDEGGAPDDWRGGAGWFDSSWDLNRGLEVRESWSDDHRVRGWIEDFLAAQRAIGHTDSPSAMTAIA